MLPAFAALLTTASGPAQIPPNLQMKNVKVAPGRVEVPKFAFDPRLVPDRSGTGRWIEIPGGESALACRFRYTWDLAAKPRSARIWFSADAHARIYVNGTLAARGPDDGGQDYPGQQTGRWFVNTQDVTRLMRRGRNVIAVELFDASAMAGRYNSTGRPGFLLDGSLELSDGQTMGFGTDDQWRGSVASEWRMAPSPTGGNALQFDAAAEAAGWRTASFDDRGWPSCVTANNRWPRLVRSEIPPRLETPYPWQEVVRPTTGVEQKGRSIVFRQDGSAAVRFDRVFSGFLHLRVRGQDGAILTIEPNETNQPGHNRMATVRLRDGEQSISLPFYDSFSVVNLSARGVISPLEVVELRADFVAQPVAYRGAFACSDERLNEIWTTSRWLTQICQQTHHLDSPHHQEPICDPGDYLIISLNNYYAFGEPWLARQDLRKYAWLLEATRYRPFHTSYALLWLQMLLDYYDYTGDAALVKELSPQVHALLAQFATYRGKNGILSEAPDYMFMDWVTIAGFATHHPPAVIGQGYMTAFYARALSDGIRVAEIDGSAERAKEYAKERAEIAEAYERELWDEKTGLYRDGRPFVTMAKPHPWLPADRDIETHSTQNNVLAVLYDLAPKERQEAIMRRLMSKDLNAQPYYMHFVFAALDHAGLFDEFGTAQMRRWKIEKDAQSFREMWGAGDYSHAWQCTPMYQMSARVLGVMPTSPGYATFRVKPRPSDLEWAKGTVPTSRGPIHAEWKWADGSFRLKVKVPRGTTAELVLPEMAYSRITLDGKATVPGQRLTVKGGAHEVVGYP